MPAELSPTQDTVLFGLTQCIAREGCPVTAREVADYLGRGWTKTSVSDALYKLGQKGRSRRVGWAGSARTWEAVD